FLDFWNAGAGLRRALSPRNLFAAGRPLLCRFPANFRPGFEPGFDFCLVAAAPGTVKLLPVYAVREIVLARDAFLSAVIVNIASAIALIAHELCGRIQDVLRGRERAAFLGKPHRRAICRIGGVRFWRG